MKITNTSTGPRGFWHNGVLRLLEKGQSAEPDLSEDDHRAADSTGFFAFEADQPVESDDELEALKARADDLGVEYGARIGVDTLRERIAEAEKAQG